MLIHCEMRCDFNLKYFLAVIIKICKISRTYNIDWCIIFFFWTVHEYMYMCNMVRFGCLNKLRGRKTFMN